MSTKVTIETTGEEPVQIIVEKNLDPHRLAQAIHPALAAQQRIRSDRDKPRTKPAAPSPTPSLPGV